MPKSTTSDKVALGNIECNVGKLMYLLIRESVSDFNELYVSRDVELIVAKKREERIIVFVRK